MGASGLECARRARAQGPTCVVSVRVVGVGDAVTTQVSSAASAGLLRQERRSSAPPRRIIERSCRRCSIQPCSSVQATPSSGSPASARRPVRPCRPTPCCRLRNSPASTAPWRCSALPAGEPTSSTASTCGSKIPLLIELRDVVRIDYAMAPSERPEECNAAKLVLARSARGRRGALGRDRHRGRPPLGPGPRHSRCRWACPCRSQEQVGRPERQRAPALADSSRIGRGVALVGRTLWRISCRRRIEGALHVRSGTTGRGR